MQTEIILLLQNVSRLPSHPIPVQGMSGKVYGHAVFNSKVADGHHHFKLPYGDETWKILRDLTLGSHRPNSSWFIREIIVNAGNDTEMQLAQMLDAAQFENEQLKEENSLIKKALQTPKADLLENDPEMKPALIPATDSESTAAKETIEEESLEEKPAEKPADPTEGKSFREIRKLAKDAGIDTTAITEIEELRKLLRAQK